MKNRIQLKYELDNIKRKLQDCLEEFWNKIISICYFVGVKLNHTEEYTTSKLDCELIGVYSYFGQYDKAYDVMVIMAKK